MLSILLYKAQYELAWSTATSSGNNHNADRHHSTNNIKNNKTNSTVLNCNFDIGYHNIYV